jgi:hypothetical protein
VAETPEPGLVAYWSFDGVAGRTADDPVGGNDGLLTGDPVWMPDAGRFAGALQFDGLDDCVVAGRTVLNPAEGAVAVFAWVKDGAPGQVIVSQEGGTDWLLADADFGNLQTTLSMPGTSGRKATPPGPPLTSEVAITDGNWHHIGLTWDGGTRRLYVDDALVAEDTQSSLADCSGGLQIGCGSDMTPGTFWKGLIDDVRVYNYAVSEPR